MGNESIGRVSACPACGSARARTTGECPNCGAVFGEQHRCPHCRGVTRVEESRDLRWVCAACGGPRIPALDAGVARTREESEALVRARAELAHERKTGLAAAAMVALAGLGFAVGFVALSRGLSSGYGFFFVGLLFLKAAMKYGKRTTAAKAKASAALDHAWQVAAEQVMRAHGGTMTARELRDAMRLPEEDAERLLAKMSVDNRARVEVGHDADLHYVRISDGTGSEPHARVDAGAVVDEGAELDASARVRGGR